MKILIDNGHGARDITKGKFSPSVTSLGIDDKTIVKDRFREGEFNRLVARALVGTMLSCLFPKTQTLLLVSVAVGQMLGARNLARIMLSSLVFTLMPLGMVMNGLTQTIGLCGQV